MKKSFVIICSCMTLFSCYEDINLSSYKGEEMTVVNCLAHSDTVVMADISSTWFFTRHKPSESIPGLAVELTVNGRSEGLMDYQNGKYRSAYRPQAGDIMRLTTVVDGKEISACDSMPGKARITNVEVTYHRVISSGGMSIDPYGNITQDDYDDEFTYHITFKAADPGLCYYFVQVDGSDYMQMLGMMDYTYEPLFQQTSERVNRTLASLKVEGQFGLPFSLEGEDGQEYTLTIKETGAPYFYSSEEYGRRTVRLYSISESYYRYVITLLSDEDASSWQGQLARIGLVEPVAIYSNITGGIGIFGCLAADSCQLNIWQAKKIFLKYCCHTATDSVTN